MGAAAQFWIDSIDCNIHISSFVEVHNIAEDQKAIFYVMMVTVVCLAHLYGCVQVIRHISVNEIDGTRYSIATIVMLTSWDVFVCFFHFYQALIVKVEFFWGNKEFNENNYRHHSSTLSLQHFGSLFCRLSLKQDYS